MTLLFFFCVGARAIRAFNEIMNAFHRSFVAALAIALSPTSLFAGGWTAKAYEIGKQDGPVLFTVDRTTAADGRSSRTVFTSPEGQELAVEKMEFDAAGTPTRYMVEHTQSGTSGVVEAQGGKLVFTYKSADGKVKTNEEDLPKIWATGPMVVPLLSQHWSTLMKGESVNFRLASWERAETIGFEIFKESVEKNTAGREVVILKMKPSSFFIAALVKPLRFEMRPDGTFLEAMTGRTLPKRVEGDKFKDWDAQIFYTAK